MKEILAVLLFVVANLSIQAQCSSVGVQISFSDTTTISLYHAGFFNIPSGFDNVVNWTVSAFDGELIHEDITSGDFNDQSNSLFQHEVTISDSMKATIVITNETEGIICTMNDTLYWEETEVLPGTFIGNWAVLSNNGGVEEVISSVSEASFYAENIKLFPSPTHDYFTIHSDDDFYSFAIVDVNGHLLAKYDDVGAQDQIDISQYSAGIYFVQFWNRKGKLFCTKKLIKI